MIRFADSNATWPLASRMAEHALAAEVVRLQKLNLDEVLRRSVEEAEQLLNAGHSLEAEALLQNTAARMRLKANPCSLQVFDRPRP